MPVFLSHTRHDTCLLYYFFPAHRLEHFELRVATDAQYDREDKPVIPNFTHCLTFHDRFPRGQLRTFLCEQPVVGRYFMVTIPAQQYLTLCEVEVFGERGATILYRYNCIAHCWSVIHLYEQYIYKWCICMNSIISFIWSITRYFSVIYILSERCSAKVITVTSFKPWPPWGQIQLFCAFVFQSNVWPTGEGTPTQYSKILW